jgi:hypothetical protein
VLLTLVEIALTAESEDDRRQAVEVAEQGLAELVSSDTSSSILERPKWKVRHLWLVGRLLAAKGQLREAEKVLDHCVAEALELGFPATAAVASLDLALVLARRGDLGELRAVAGAACVVLEAAGLKPDAWGAQSLLLDCDLAAAESVIVEGLQRAGGASLRRTRERS